jgi:hypothetical protein
VIIRRGPTVTSRLVAERGREKHALDGMRRTTTRQVDGSRTQCQGALTDESAGHLANQRRNTDEIPVLE